TPSHSILNPSSRAPHLSDMKIKFFSLIALVIVGSLTAAAQSPSIVGTWALTAADKLLPDGTRSHDYGDAPHGLVIFTADGHYSVQIYREQRTKFASGDKTKGSPDEYKDASLGMSVHFGKYSVDPGKGTITFQIDRASFPNWDGTTQVRAFELKDDELSWKVPPRPDGSTPITVLKRIN
ncbi:MAG TPA: lipocalin-like domain-containing protein, partial [Terriglobales bacterium]|nr:lipocalin-like domain-containing protein [Terriglobales bacterium]